MIIMNRNTSPIKPLSKEQIIKVVEETEFNQYPDQERARFIQLYADYFDLNPAQIEVANGSDEWIQKLIITYGQRGVMTLDPDFIMYATYTGQFYPAIKKVACDRNYDFQFDRVVRAVLKEKPSLFFISNPHNPTGTLFAADDLQRLADALAEVDGVLALDECYIDFAGNCKRPAADNIIILRTLSKVYGMAGLRIGMAIAPPEIMQRLKRINHPYPVNSLSLNLATELFSDRRKLAQFKAYQLESKRRLEQTFAGLAGLIEIKKSYANYLFSYGEKAVDLARHLISRGFLPRLYEAENLADTARYSIIRLEDYQALNQAISDWREQYV